MTPKITLFALLIVLMLGGAVQAQVTTGKMYIVQDASRNVLANATNPTDTLAQTDRVELTAVADGANVSVKRCGALGCTDALGRLVRADSVDRVNSQINLKNINAQTECRVCFQTKSTETSLEDYVSIIKSAK